MPTILARPANLSTFSFFGDLIAQPPLTALARVEASLGSQLIRAEILRGEIEALRHEADSDRWQQTAAMLAVGLLLGAVIGCTLVTRMVGK
jgi:hypothetical protein